MAITEKQKRWLKKRVHHLKPVVIIGQHGLSEPVLAEIDQALTSHELLKVRVNAGDHDERDQAIQQICAATQSELITRIGNVAAFFRANPGKKDPIPLPLL